MSKLNEVFMDGKLFPLNAFSSSKKKTNISISVTFSKVRFKEKYKIKTKIHGKTNKMCQINSAKVLNS